MLVIFVFVCIEKGIKRMTRGLKLQAQKQLDFNTAMKVQEQKSQQVIVDHNKLKVWIIISGPGTSAAGLSNSCNEE